MNAPLATSAQRAHRLAQHIADACGRIAPTWPLDRFIAVNPYWGHVMQPITRAAAELGSQCGTRLLMPRSFYREQWRAGKLRHSHLQAAISAAGASCTVDALIAALDEPAPPLPQLPLATEVIGEERQPGQAMPWRDLVTHQISQHCAAYFDRFQAAWGPNRDLGLYPSWQQSLAADRGLPVHGGHAAFSAKVRALPADATRLIAAATEALGIAEDTCTAYYSALLLSINGWAAWCAHERWQARLAQGDDDHIVDLLAIRLAWEWLLLEDAGAQTSWTAARHDAHALAARVEAAQQTDWLWQRALEEAYQQPLCRGLAQAPQAAGAPHAPPLVQAVFCIDVRSEVFRRALEATCPSIQTLGFAGFFGLPIAYSPLGSALVRPQLPGLLAPTLCVTETCESPSLGEALKERRRQGLQWRQCWSEFRLAASSGFSFVESMGLLYAGKLLKDSLPSEAPPAHWEKTGLPARHVRRMGPRLARTGTSSESDDTWRVDLAFGILRAMGLTSGFAPLVLLTGHGSQSANNPHAAGLDCGACGGQTGEVNARVLAALLNESSVRQALRERGVDIPAATRFVAGLHNTTVDAVTLFDLQDLPDHDSAAMAQLQAWLAEAGRAARAERAAALGLANLAGDAAALQRAVRTRANDWAQVRPEWGLADNAAFIVAPRARSQHLNLGGRAFLHDYRWEQDTDLKVLELIMTAPMVVTNWINLQYYASTVDNRRYGSGNKLLHNVVGGRIGVFEGNGGDLRIGLPWQSLHDGHMLRHTPLRLSVFIEAPRPAIERIVAAHEVVRQLLHNGWLHLFQIEPGQREMARYSPGLWHVMRDDGPESQDRNVARSFN